MNHSKIIFLDFDGVLNTEHHQRQLLYERKAWQDKYGTCFDRADASKCVRLQKF